jgi:hypothetical protein
VSVEAIEVSKLVLDESVVPLDVLESERVVSEIEVDESLVLSPTKVLVPPAGLSVDILKTALREVVPVIELSNELVEYPLLV